MECAYCGSEIKKKVHKGCKNVYCNKLCSSLGRRLNKTEDQKKEEKRLYDIEYRNKNKEKITNNKRKYNQTEAGRATQKRSRNKRKEKHLQYCRTNQYKSYKKSYDKVYRAKKLYGEYWESVIIIQDIELQIDNREVKQQLNLINKSQKRKRNYEQIKRKEFKRSPLGNIERS